MINPSIKKAFDIEHGYYELSEDPEDCYDTILEAMRSVLWYNTLTPAFIDVKQALERELSKKVYSIWDCDNVGRPDTENCKNEQFEVFWILIVQMFGNYGVSPRHGWVDNDRLKDALDFVNMLLEGNE